MRHFIGRILLFALLANISTASRADECFCLWHPDSRAILRGCVAKGAIFFCTDPETLKKSAQRISSDWKRIEAGTDQCFVCQPAPRGAAVKLPRGEEDATK